MNREQLAHVVRAAATITGDGDIVIIGSQSILGAADVGSLPEEATMSMEADVAFRSDVDARKADAVDGAIGELSQFHETYGYYAQGVEISTAVLPAGWEDRAETSTGRTPDPATPAASSRTISSCRSSSPAERRTSPSQPPSSSTASWLLRPCTNEPNCWTNQTR